MNSVRMCALVGVVGASACQESNAPDFQTIYFDVHLEPGIEPCGGQLAAYDTYFARIFSLWAGRPPTDVRARLHVVRKPHCTGIEQSCAHGREAWLVRNIAEYHEIAHIMHGIVDGSSAKSLTEGVAEALGPVTPYVVQADALSAAGPDFMFEDPLDPVHYTYAAAWTRYLIDEHGSDRLRQYFVAMKAFATPSSENFREEFSAAFGWSLDDDWDEFAGEARCPFDTWFCADLHPIDLPYRLAAATCESDEWLGFEDTNAPDSEDFTPMKIVHVEVEQPGSLSLRSRHARIDIGRCGDCSAALGTFGYGSEEDEQDVTLPTTPGTYALVIHARGQPEISIERVPN